MKELKDLALLTQAYVKRRGISVKDIAEEAGVNQSVIYRLMDGTQGSDPGKAVTIAKALRLNKPQAHEWVLLAITKKAREKVPEIEEIIKNALATPAENVVREENSRYTNTSTEVIAFPKLAELHIYSVYAERRGDQKVLGKIPWAANTVEAGAFGILAKGPAMGDLDGSIVIFMPATLADVEDGDFVVVQLPGWDAAAMRRLSHDPSGKIILSAENATFPPTVADKSDVKVLGRKYGVLNLDPRWNKQYDIK